MSTSLRSSGEEVRRVYTYGQCFIWRDRQPPDLVNAGVYEKSLAGRTYSGSHKLKIGLCYIPPCLQRWGKYRVVLALDRLLPKNIGPIWSCYLSWSGEEMYSFFHQGYIHIMNVANSARILEYFFSLKMLIKIKDEQLM